MPNMSKQIFSYVKIILLTLIAIEILCFSVLVIKLVFVNDKSWRYALVTRVNQHPLSHIFEDAKGGGEGFSPLTQFGYIKGNVKTCGLAVNKYGFVGNGNEDHTLNGYPDKADGVKRIVMLGGSSMVGCTASSNSHTIPAYLERLLNATSVDVKYQVLNFGVVGYYTYSELEKIQSEVAYLSPDIIIMLDGFNDACYSYLEHLRQDGLSYPIMNWADYSYWYFDAMNGLSGRKPPPFMTYTFILFDRLIRGHTKKKRLDVYNSLPAAGLTEWLREHTEIQKELIKSNLDFIAAWTSRKNIYLLAYLQPHPWQWKELDAEISNDIELMGSGLGPGINRDEYSKIMIKAFNEYANVYKSLDAEFADIAHTRFVDMRRLFNDTDEHIYNDAIHYTDIGNQLIAKCIFEDLVNFGIAHVQ